jgi:hypothetical protein
MREEFLQCAADECLHTTKEKCLESAFDAGVRSVIFGKAKAPDVVPKPTQKKSPPWFLFANQFKGLNENDPILQHELVPKWRLLGLNLKTIAQPWAAWCGLACAVALSGVGIDFIKNGAAAKNWDSYALNVDWRKNGIPQGAIVRINNAGNCTSTTGNHVSMANGDCTAEELLRPRATIDLYGGNQGNSWKVTAYPAANICAVRWPKDQNNPLPGKITVSKNCGSNVSKESTR